MNLLLLFLFSINHDKIIEAHFTEIAPFIDGFIEDTWQIADSIYDFIQFRPYENELPSERTVVFALQDEENLYFAFRCYAEKIKPVSCLTADEDFVTVRIDPFGSKTIAYFFNIYASGMIYDGWILDDGRRMDASWEGIWYKALKFYDDRYEVEIRIPFKSIRYKKNLKEWGITFLRYMASNKETDSWNRFIQLEGPMVSKYGVLRGIEPKVTGYYFEIFPEVFIRYDKYREGKGLYKLRGSVNFKWDLKPEATLNATINPDFAQIETDPFELNLERFPIYLDERRPFFLEGEEIFRMSDLGEGKEIFNPLNIFYSRKIGKSINGEIIPILGGIKFTNKSELLNVGILGAYTHRYIYDDVEIEPKRGFGVLRLKRKVLENSDIGVLLSGTIVDFEEYNYAIGFDGVYRRGIKQFILQSAISDKNKKKGWALSSAYSDLFGNFLTELGLEIVQDSFDVSDIGFVPWTGLKRLLIFGGPYKTFPKGYLRELYTAFGILTVKEPGESDWSRLAASKMRLDFRNNWNIYFELLTGSYYEANTNYLYKSISLSASGQITGNFFNCGVNYGYKYNYRRGFPAYQGLNWISYSYSIIPPLSISLSSFIWVEWDTDNTIIAITPRVTPRANIRLGADINLEFFNEFVMETPGMDFPKTELITNRFGLIFSWKIAPKSWLYFAFNDYRIRGEDGEFELQNKIGAIKVKYLIYF